MLTLTIHMATELAGIIDLLSNQKILKEATYHYIANTLIPNIRNLYSSIQHEIINEQSSLERMYLHERRFVESIKLLTHPEIANRLVLIAEDLNVNDERPYHIGIILVGSAAFGGLLVRESLGKNEHSDLDMVGTYLKLTGNDKISVFEYMSSVVLPKIDQLMNSSMIKHKGTESYKLCDAHNVKIMNFEAIDDLEKAKDVLEQIAQDKLLGNIGETYFLPSYPPELNNVSRYFLLTALHQLATSDKNKWSKVRGKVISSFKENAKIIKPKHFGKEKTEVEKEFSQKIDKINEYLSTLLTELIDSTNY